MNHKQKQWTGWGAFLAAIAVASGLVVTGTNEIEEEKAAPQPTVTQTVTPSPDPEPSPSASIDLLPVGYEVDRVVDGDTVKLMINGVSQSVRIIGIDTPETVHPRMDVQCYGPEASARAKELLEGKTVQLEQDLSQGETDRYGRLLGYLTLEDGRDFGRIMIEEGYAEEVTYDGWYEKQGRYKFYEDVAREQGVGQWSAC